MSKTNSIVPDTPDSEVRFVCGSDITFGKNGEKFAVDPMGFDTVEAAIAENAKLHSSFGYNIYEVDATATLLVRSFGFRQGTQCSGFKVRRFVCSAYDQLGSRETKPAW
jgi:hypothetical protein